MRGGREKSQHCCHSHVNGPRLREPRRRRTVVAAGSNGTRRCTAAVIRLAAVARGCAACDFVGACAREERRPAARGWHGRLRAGSRTRGTLAADSHPTVARGLVNPWALAFLPDGRMLVTERPGRLRIVAKDGKLSPPLAGVPQVLRVRPGRTARRRARPRLRAEPGRSISATPSRRPAAAAPRWRARGSSTARQPRLDDVKVIFRQEGPLSSGNHFGCRIVQAPRRQSVPHDGRSLRLPRRGAEPRQPSRQDRAHHAGRRGAARQSVRRPQATPSRKSGATATATRKAPRCIRRPASCGSTSTARAAATRSTFRTPARTTAGR